MKRIIAVEYRQELRKVESALRKLKEAMHQTGYQSSFNWQELYRLKAEATRLYLLRTQFREDKHPISGGWFLEIRYNKKVYPAPIPSAPHLRWNEDEIRDAVMNGEPGWYDRFTEEYEAPAPRIDLESAGT